MNALARRAPTYEDLEEENRWLRAELGLQADARRLGAVMGALRLTKAQARILLALRDRAGPMTLPAMQLAAAEGVEADTDLKIVSVYICNIRKRLGRDAIRNVWGVGYELTAAGRQQVDQALWRGAS